MTLTASRVRVQESPAKRGWMRLAADLHSDVDQLTEELWLDVPAAVGDGLQPRADAFLAWLAPLAAKRKEMLHVDAPVDAALLTRVREVLRIWHVWYPELAEAEVVLPRTEQWSMRTDLPPAQRRIASMFTGGVDSFFTVLRHAAGEGTPETLPIDDLLYVHGFDIPLSNAPALATVDASLRQAAEELGRRYVPVATNLRETRFAATDWPRLSHAAALAGVAHALSGTYATVLLGSSAGYGDLRVWGSHPLTDPMFSSSRTAFLHDGAAFMRVQKTSYVVQSPVALKHLRVCWKSSAGDNCGLCNSCIRTMLALDALGVLDQCATFRRADLDLGRAARVHCRYDYDYRQFGYVRDLADEMQRPDIAAAVEAAMTGSRRLASQLAFVKKLRDRRVFWRIAPALERRLLRNWID